MGAIYTRGFPNSLVWPLRSCSQLKSHPVTYTRGVTYTRDFTVINIGFLSNPSLTFVFFITITHYESALTTSPSGGGSCCTLRTISYVGAIKAITASWWDACRMSLPFTCGKQWINSLAPGGFDYSLKLVNFKLIPMINILSIFYELLSGEYHNTSLIISQHWFR